MKCKEWIENIGNHEKGKDVIIFKYIGTRPIK